MHELYPDIEPFFSEHMLADSLNPDGTHQIYVEQCGNPSGIPVVFLHGGPGSGCRAQHRCYFDPEIYHIILFDQRGCGRSRPSGELANNTTQALILDMEQIRQQLDINSWMLFGGSWGATLGLYYAQHYPSRVSSMILRGVFLGRPQDIDWVYTANGAAKLFPEAWQQLVKPLPLAEQSAPLPCLYRQLTGDNAKLSTDAFSRLQLWESSIVMLRDYHYGGETVTKGNAENSAIAPAIIQLHYSLNHCFIADQPLLDNLEPIGDIPTQLIHGRYDLVCPVEQSWQLSQRWPQANLNITNLNVVNLNIVPLAGHAASEPALVDALIAATIEFSQIQK